MLKIKYNAESFLSIWISERFRPEYVRRNDLKSFRIYDLVDFIIYDLIY